MNHTEFSLQPVLEGPLLKLRPLKVEDFDQLYIAASDSKTWEQHPNFDRYKREEFSKYFAGAVESKGAFVIIEKATKQIIGSSRYYKLDLSADEVMIGYTFLHHKYWGGLYNRELKTIMLRHAFQYVSNVYFEIGEKNIRSRKAIEKIGGRLIQRETSEDVPHVVYRIRREEFESDGLPLRA